MAHPTEDRLKGKRIVHFNPKGERVPHVYLVVGVNMAGGLVIESVHHALEPSPRDPDGAHTAARRFLEADRKREGGGTFLGVHVMAAPFFGIGPVAVDAVAALDCDTPANTAPGAPQPCGGCVPCRARAYVRARERPQDAATPEDGPEAQPEGERPGDGEQEGEAATDDHTGKVQCKGCGQWFPQGACSHVCGGLAGKLVKTVPPEPDPCAVCDDGTSCPGPDVVAYREERQRIHNDDAGGCEGVLRWPVGDCENPQCSWQEPTPASALDVLPKCAGCGEGFTGEAGEMCIDCDPGSKLLAEEDEPKPNPCLDPDLMNGAADQYSGDPRRRGEHRRTEHGPRWESQNPGKGSNSTHVARARRKWKKRERRATRRTGRWHGPGHLRPRDLPDE